jgi:MFS family permease
MKTLSINAGEKRATISLSLIFAFRMLGLFMVLPVLSLYAHNLIGATPALIGFALGSYGLTQACLQLPLGMLSDKIGRKRVITGGLLVFIAGSIVCALSHTMAGLIMGRALQGAGAIGATLIAFIADLTREETRTKAMAIVGVTIGLSFAIAMIAGPVLSSLIGVSGIFWLTALLGLIGIGILFTLVPTPTHCEFHRDVETLPALLISTIKDLHLVRLYAGIFTLHAILTASFVVLPPLLQEAAGLEAHRQWLLYLPVLLLAFVSMIPCIIFAEKYHRLKPVFVSSVALIALSQGALWEWHGHYLGVAFCLYGFFTAFTFLEASLPSLVSKTAPRGSKGTAMGVYSTAQFLGIFAGGSLAGLLYGRYGASSVFLMSLLLAIIWLIIAIKMPARDNTPSNQLS